MLCTVCDYRGAHGSPSWLLPCISGFGGLRATSRLHLPDRNASNADAQNDDNRCYNREHGQSCAALESKSAAHCTVKVICRAAEVATVLMIFGNRGRQCVPAIDTRQG